MELEEQKILADRWIDGGYLLKTKKGANFTGYAEGVYYNQHMKHWGVVVVSMSVGFEGTAHVYPVNQLEPA